MTPEPFESTDAALEFFATRYAALYDRDEPMEYLEILGRKGL